MSDVYYPKFDMSF